MNHIRCPDCDAIRETVVAACPECGRCANCGQQIAEGVQQCPCGFPGDEKILKRIVNRFGIPYESLKKETAKREKQKQYEPIVTVLKILVLIVSLALGTATAMFVLADANPVTQVMSGIFLVSLLTFFYWAIFQGIGKVVRFLVKLFSTREKDGY